MLPENDKYIRKYMKRAVKKFQKKKHVRKAKTQKPKPWGRKAK
jgi:hypothetical protein